MARRDFSKLSSALCLATGLALLAAAAPIRAESPAAIAPAEEQARTSFAKFAQTWMKKVQQLAAEQKRSIRPGAPNTMVTYRSYGDEFTTELRPTGHPSSPYVGILRYEEQIFSCSDVASKSCTLSSRIPVTEIFRYQDGRWKY